jgi:hypothetical protein
VFISGVAFLLLTAIGVRQLIVSAIPTELYSAVVPARPVHRPGGVPQLRHHRVPALPPP